MGALILRSTYRRRPDATRSSSWFGTLDVELTGDEPATKLPPGTTLAVWCTVVIEPTAASDVRVIERLAGHVTLGPIDADQPIELPWRIDALRTRFPARHANDGPEAAWLILPDGSTIDIDVEPCVAIDPRTERPPRATATTTVDDDVVEAPRAIAVVPHPMAVDVRASDRRTGRARLASGRPDAVWSSIADLVRRAGHDVFDGGDRPLDVTIGIEPSLAGEAYRLRVGDGTARLVGGGEQGLRHGLVTLAQILIGPTTGDIDITDEPRVGFRGVHLDLARRWYEPDVVERLIDIAAWRKLNHVHLHLTDDEGWRFHVDGYPTAAAIGATRGHGLPLPALCGSGPDPYGRAYTDVEIGRWVERADALGITLVPEVDVPAHCHAALVAIPELRDPDDTSTATSVQGYPNNVLVPGLATTMPFLEAVFATIARLFPSSPIVHIGGDEVPAGAWSGSPAAQAYAARHGVSTTEGIATSFQRELVEMIRSTTSRRAAMWEEAALAGVEPSGYAVAWTSPDAGARLDRAGHRVVMAPGQAYYLDMAPGRDWHLPGGSWAGNVTLADTCAYDPYAGWHAGDDPGPHDVGPHDVGPHGVQACIWGEHVADLDTLDTLVFPRLDAVAERAWTGRIVGGPDALAARARDLPRFTT